MRLFIIRHGEAQPQGGPIHDDADRVLTPAGLDQVTQVAARIKSEFGGVQQVLSSPVLRAQQTARVIARTMGDLEIEVSNALAPGASHAGIVVLVSERIQSTSIALVGHHPDVTVWISFLTGMDPTVCPVFGTASVAALDFAPGRKKAMLLWFKTAEQMSGH